MQYMDIKTWYEKSTNGDSYNAVGVKSGVQPSTIWRQQPDKFSPENLVKIARAYGRPAFEPLIIAGLLTDDDVAILRSDDALKDASDEQLIDELSRRLKDNHSEIVSDPESAWNMPISVDVDAAAKHDPDKRLSKGRDEEFAD
jgi:hypothetical protein